MFSGSLRWIPVMFILVLGACATRTGDTAMPETVEIQVQVENDLIPPTTLSVYAVPEVGARRLLGVVRPNRTQTLELKSASGDSFAFVAETTAGREIVSPEITLTPGDGAVWNISNNIVVPM